MLVGWLVGWLSKQKIATLDPNPPINNTQNPYQGVYQWWIRTIWPDGNICSEWDHSGHHHQCPYQHIVWKFQQCDCGRWVCHLDGYGLYARRQHLPDVLHLGQHPESEVLDTDRLVHQCDQQHGGLRSRPARCHYCPLLLYHLLLLPSGAVHCQHSSSSSS